MSVIVVVVNSYTGAIVPACNWRPQILLLVGRERRFSEVSLFGVSGDLRHSDTLTHSRVVRNAMQFGLSTYYERKRIPPLWSLNNFYFYNMHSPRRIIRILAAVAKYQWNPSRMRQDLKLTESPLHISSSFLGDTFSQFYVLIAVILLEVSSN